MTVQTKANQLNPLALGRRAAAGGLLAVALLGVAACGNAAAPVKADEPTTSASAAAPVVPTAPAGPAAAAGGAPATPTPTATTPAAPAAPATGTAEPTESIEVDGHTISVPPGFTFPVGSKVDNAFGASVILSEPDAGASTSYFRSALPKAGYTITVDTGDTLTFSGRGYHGTIAASDSDTTVNFSADVSDVTGSDDSASEADMLTGEDLDVTNVPYYWRFPIGTKLTELNDPVTGASFTITAPAPADVLTFYRKVLPLGYFTVTHDSTENGVTTIKFTDEDTESGTIVVGPTSVRVTTSLE